MSIREEQKLKQWSLFLAVLFTTACSDQDLEYLLPQASVMTVSCANNEVEYGLQSKEFNSFVSWFSGHKTGWHESPASYLSTVKITMNNHTFHLLEELVVINTGNTQLVQSAETAELINALCHT